MSLIWLCGFFLVIFSVSLETEGKLCFNQLCSSNSRNTLRGCDSQGCGNYGARRGSRKHRGIDIKCSAGDTVNAPFDAVVVRRARPYGVKSKNFKKAFNTGVLIQGRGAWKDYKAKLFYVSPSHKRGTKVNAGAKLGTYIKLPYSGITQHVHLALYKKSKIVNPTSFVC